MLPIKVIGGHPGSYLAALDRVSVNVAMSAQIDLKIMCCFLSIRCVQLSKSSKFVGYPMPVNTHSLAGGSHRFLSQGHRGFPHRFIQFDKSIRSK